MYHLRNTHIQKISIYTKKHKSRIRELTQVRARESLGIPYWKRGALSGLGRIIYPDRLANPLKKKKKKKKYTKSNTGSGENVDDKCKQAQNS